MGPPAGDVQEAAGINSLESKFRATVVFDREKKLPWSSLALTPFRDPDGAVCPRGRSWGQDLGEGKQGHGQGNRIQAPFLYLCM